jgi:hypothetical protein
MSGRLDCVEFQRLDHIYERYRCIWARYVFPLPGHSPGRLDKLTHEALLNRNIAAKCKANHQKYCPICRAG